MRMPKISTETWVVWISGVLVATATAVFVLMKFAYGEFETKEHARETMAQHEKLDALIFNQLTEINRKIDNIQKERR